MKCVTEPKIAIKEAKENLPNHQKEASLSYSFVGPVSGFLLSKTSQNILRIFRQYRVA